MNRYEKLYNAIIEKIAEGYTIQVNTHTHAFRFTRKEQFKFDSTGVYTQRGKKWDCINFNKITYFK